MILFSKSDERVIIAHQTEEVPKSVSSLPYFTRVNYSYNFNFSTTNKQVANIKETGLITVFNPSSALVKVCIPEFEKGKGFNYSFASFSAEGVNNHNLVIIDATLSNTGSERVLTLDVEKSTVFDSPDFSTLTTTNGEDITTAIKSSDAMFKITNEAPLGVLCKYSRIHIVGKKTKFLDIMSKICRDHDILLREGDSKTFTLSTAEDTSERVPNSTEHDLNYNELEVAPEVSELHVLKFTVPFMRQFNLLEKVRIRIPNNIKASDYPFLDGVLQGSNTIVEIRILNIGYAYSYKANRVEVEGTNVSYAEKPIFSALTSAINISNFNSHATLTSGVF